MTLAEVAVFVLIIIGLATLRIGVPLMVMWLLNQACCRILHLKS